MPGERATSFGKRVRTAGLSGDADRPQYPWRHPEHHRGLGLPRTTSIGSAADKANTVYLANNAANRDNAGKAAKTPKSSKLTELSGPPESANGEFTVEILRQIRGVL